MKLFSLSFSSILIRFYLMMAIVIVAFFINVPALAILSLPVFFTCLMGVRFSRQPKKASETIKTKAPEMGRAHQPVH